MAQDIATKIENRYEVLGELGRGGMGIVYKANDLKMGRVVAIKVLTAQADGKDRYQERFLREAKSIAKMQHPNILVVHDYGNHGGSPYMVMEYVEGIPLNKMIASRARLTPLVKVDYMVQVCNALHYAHQQGIIHRDVKPGNIMVLEGGKRVKIVDFGIARTGEASDLSKTGLAMGTTRYMSPEQILGQKDLDARADIFSAGVVLYELLAGKPPWTGGADYEVMTRIIHEPFPPLSTSGDYPPTLDRILERALAKERDGRYPTAEEFSRELIELEVPLKEQAVDQAMVQFERGDLLRANDLVSQILYIDTRHREAIQLRGKLQEVAQLQQWRSQVQQLRSTAAEAVGQQRYNDALSAVEEAAAIDPANTELFHYRELVRDEVKRREDVRKKLELAKRAQEINDLASAQDLVEKVLEADPQDAQAQAMKTELEQERKRQQLAEIAQEVSGALEVHAFARAAEFIQRIEALDPSFAPLASLKQRLAAGEIEHQQVQTILAQASEAGIDSALEILTAARAKFPNSKEITAALEAVQLASGKKDDKKGEEARLEKTVEKMRPQPAPAPTPGLSVGSGAMAAAAARAPSPAASPVLHHQPRRAGQQKFRWGWAALVVFVIAAVSGATYLVHKARLSVSVKLHANVEGAKFTLEGRSIDPGNLSLVPGKEYTIEASQEGYQTDVKKITPTRTAGGPIEFVLTPLAPKLSPSSDLMEGPISLWEHQPSTGDVGFLQVQANVPGAELRIDKTSKLPIPNGSKMVFLKAGKHQVQVVAPGYPDSEMREVEIQKGQTVKQAFTLSSRQAQLSLTSVEPGAKLYVDGEQQGTTPAGGSFKLAVSPGEHKVVLKKDNYEDSPTITRTFKANQPEALTGKQLPLQKYGSIQFNDTPPTATITIRSANGQSRTVQPNETVPLPKGAYAWTVEAEHFQPKSGNATVEPGGATSISPGLQLVGPQELKAAELFENPSLWSARDNWSVFKHPGYGWLMIRNGSFNVIIEKKRKVEWTLDYRGEADKIIYSVSGNTLSRQAISGSSAASEPVKAQFKEPSKVYQFIFEIAPTQIVVRDNGNNVIDKFKRPDPSVGLGKVGFRGDISISVQRLR